MSREPVIKMTPDIFFNSITNDAENIEYRQCILGNFLKRKNTLSDLADLVVLIDKMQKLHKILKTEIRVPSIILRLKKLETYHSIMVKLEAVFSSGGNARAADDFETISNEIKILNKSKDIENLGKDIRNIKAILGKTQSIDIGANIDDHDLREAVILSLNDFKYEKSDIIDKLKSKEANDYDRKSIASELDIGSAGQLLIFENELYRDFGALLNKELIKIENLLEKHKEIITSEVLGYRDEICLYFGALKFGDYLVSNDCEYCFPTSSGATVIIDMFSLHMLVERNASKQADRYMVVKNSISLAENEDMLLITGPNNGGKTVLLESLALIQLLYQNGMLVPAKEGTLPIYKKIFTHFPKDEDIGKGAGRLGEEAGRVRDILRGISGRTLVVFNEPYITTSPLEGRDILVHTIGKFKEKGLVMYLVTHYLDILDEMEDTRGTASYVLEIVNGNKTFIARKMKPMAESFAMDIARSHGVDYDGIMKVIHIGNTPGESE
jgi:DNA mismatch repair ATPase MutS